MPPSAANPANQSTDCLLSDLLETCEPRGWEAGPASGLNATGGEAGRGTSLIWAGGAASPITRPDTPTALLSFVTVFLSAFPPWIEANSALRSPAPEDALGAGTDGAGGGGGGTIGGGGGGAGATKGS